MNIKQLTHGDIWCNKYQAKVMPDEKGNCSLCGATLNAGFDPKERLEDLRQELRAEQISYGELAELQSLVEYIDSSDVELLEAAGVPEN